VLIENPWAITAKEIFEINIMNCNIGSLKSEFIDLQQDITLKDIFNSKNNANKYITFSKYYMKYIIYYFTFILKFQFYRNFA